VDKEELQAIRIREANRTAAPDPRPETRSTDERSILALQQSAGNRAVEALLAGAPGARGVADAAAFGIPVQREPEDPPREERVWPVVWPEETEGETNEPCFDPGFQATILTGADAADRAGACLSARPPDLEQALAEMGVAHASWTSVDGSNPGRAALDEAISGIQRIGVGVAAYVLPVSERLQILKQDAMTAFGSVADAAGSMTEPGSPDEEPVGCFDDQQQVALQKAASLAYAAGSELDKRPPNYPVALGTLRSAANSLRAVKGREPGQASLRSAVKELDELVIQVGVYLAPVEAVVAEAAVAVKTASAEARAAADMSRRGAFADGGESESPDGGGAPVPSQPVEP
jgi:hypothetical protein